ncbi:MAG: YsnF/AvaK domain-containing protein [Janthinobacterium lividum]
MSKQTITAVFDTRSQADQAIAQLKAAGVPSSDITVLPGEGETGTYADEAEGRGKGFWASLEQLFGGTEDHATYRESIRRGGIMVSVRAEDARLEGIVDVLERHGSVDLDERETTWRGEGWTGHSATAGTGTGARVADLGLGGLGAGAIRTVYGEQADTASTDRATGRAAMERGTVPAAGGTVGGLRDPAEDVIQVVEERLDVGKRSVNRGKVRVHTSVVSRAVSEDVTLHDETVSVERRAVDRPVSAATSDADPFKERSIEMEEYAEEPVVAKTAHVVEEIGIRKDATDHVETIHDTLRSTKVDIEDSRGERSTGGVPRPS